MSIHQVQARRDRAIKDRTEQLGNWFQKQTQNQLLVDDVAIRKAADVCQHAADSCKFYWQCWL